jgi:hypothetical protein
MMKTLTLLLIPVALVAQEQQSKDPKDKKPYEPPPIFTDAKPLEVELHAPFSQLRKDRATETEYRQAFFKYKGDDGAVVRVPVRARTRGIWRKKNCEIPPLLLNFTKDSTKKTAFAKNDRLRLTLHCRNTDEFEQYVLQEYNLYRVHRTVSKYSYDVRLARITYIDSEKSDTLMTRWAFFSEQDEPFAERVGVKVLTTQGAGPDDLDPYESAFYGVFQFFIGNSDFSIRALHNAVLVERPDGVYLPVARDFDWSGAVNARYAVPNPILKTRTVQQRVMRGYCSTPEEYAKVFALLKEKKETIYGLYRDELMAPMKPNVVANTLKYFDEFYKIIDDPRSARREIVDRCIQGSA